MHRCLDHAVPKRRKDGVLYSVCGKCGATVRRIMSDADIAAFDRALIVSTTHRYDLKA